MLYTFQFYVVVNCQGLYSYSAVGYHSLLYTIWKLGVCSIQILYDHRFGVPIFIATVARQSLTLTLGPAEEPSRKNQVWHDAPRTMSLWHPPLWQAQDHEGTNWSPEKQLLPQGSESPAGSLRWTVATHWHTALYIMYIFLFLLLLLFIALAFRMNYYYY